MEICFAVVGMQGGNAVGVPTTGVWNVVGEAEAQ